MTSSSSALLRFARAEFDSLMRRIEDLEDALVMRATDSNGGRLIGWLLQSSTCVRA
jgi:hypothetical protein